jgi:hypothetical protein
MSSAWRHTNCDRDVRFVYGAMSLGRARPIGPIVVCCSSASWRMPNVPAICRSVGPYRQKFSTLARHFEILPTVSRRQRGRGWLVHFATMGWTAWHEAEGGDAETRHAGLAVHTAGTAADFGILRY